MTRKRTKAPTPRKLAAFVLAALLVVLVAIVEPTHASAVGWVLAALYASFVNPHLALTQPSACVLVLGLELGLEVLRVLVASQVNPDGTCNTLEGNTDPQGGREGYMVAERQRPTQTITYFLRIG